MPIETICQGCARKLRVADEHAGKKARCPQCGMIYVVPGSPAARSPDPKEDRSAAPDMRSGTQPEREEPTADRWRLRTPDGHVYGPVSRSELDRWYAEGRVPPTVSLLREGEHQWQAAWDLYPDLAGMRRPISAQHNPFAERAAPAPTSNPFSSPVSRHLLPHRGGVILTLAILGWALCPVFGPFAWAMGRADLRAMRAGRMDPHGMSTTQAGMVLGIIQTVFLLLGVGLVCVGAMG